MAADFDPYYKWLGIPPEEQPANHYRLLAVNLFETDRDVIAAAANRQMAYLQQLASGPDLKQAQKLLGEVSQARVCLLNAKQKKAYDEQLRSALPADEPQEPSEKEQPTEAPGLQAIQPVAARPTARKREGAGRAAARRPHRQKKKQNVPLMVGIGGGAAVAILIVVLMSGGSSSAKKTARGKGTQAGKSPQGQKDEGLQIPTFAEPRKKTSTKPPRNSRAKPAAGFPKVTKTRATKTTPPPPVAPNAPQGSAEPSDEESARTLLKEKYHLEEEDAWAHTWKLVNEQTRKLEAPTKSGPSGAVGGPEFDEELKRRVEAKKKAILDRWSKIYNAPSDNGGPLDKEWYHNTNRVVMFSGNPDAWYVRDDIPEITSIRAQVQREFASRRPATVNPATVGLLKDIRNRYATLAADPKVAKLLEQAGGKLAQPPGEHAQGAGKKNAGGDPHVQTPGGTNRANPGGPAAPQPSGPQVAANKPPAPQAEKPATPRTDAEFEYNFTEENGKWRPIEEQELKATVKDAKAAANAFSKAAKTRLNAINKLKKNQGDIENLKGRIAKGTAQQNTEGLKEPQKKQIDQQLLFLKNQLNAANRSLEKYKNNVDNPDANPDIEKTEEALKVAENLQKKIAQLSEKYQGYSSEEFEGVENITINTQANSYAKSLATLRETFEKQKQDLKAVSQK